MPEFTAEKPHAITCIKRSFRELLRANCGDDLTIVCDRDDCWGDSELFKWRQAVNIAASTDFTGEVISQTSGGRKMSDHTSGQSSQCTYESTLNIDVQIYVEQCDCDDDKDDCECLNAKDKSYSILGHLQHVIFNNLNQIVGRDIKYTGSNPTTNSDNDLDIAVLTATFEIKYFFDPARPWVVEQN